MSFLVTETEHVTIDGVPLDTPAWTTENLWVLWGAAAKRGTDRIVPGATGVRPYRRRPTVTRVVLTLTIYGDRAPDGSVNSDPHLGLQRNVDQLRSAVVDTPARTDGTRTAVVHMADGTLRSGQVHVEALELGGDKGPDALSATLDISILQGELK